MSETVLGSYLMCTFSLVYDVAHPLSANTNWVGIIMVSQANHSWEIKMFCFQF